MKRKIKKIFLYIIGFIYMFLLLFLRGEVVKKSREVYKKEKELIEMEYRVELERVELLKITFDYKRGGQEDVFTRKE